ncbi:AraC family transcriptional regulator [Curvivirga sp.]|uniref:AraC family transcriptional regulator n=1 Tax=Curvivirga sp. TaxID=2856848 RepID=UPI003B591BAF
MNKIISFPNAQIATHTSFKIGFYLLPGFSMISFSSLMETLRIVNKILGYEYYEIYTFSKTGGTVISSNGIPVHSNRTPSSQSSLDILFIVGQDYALCDEKEKFEKFNFDVSACCHILAAIDSGVEFLARHGYLDGYKVAIYWRKIKELEFQYHQIEFCNSLFVIDRNRYTASGASAGIDLLLAIIQVKFGHDLAAQTSDYLCHHAPRAEDTLQGTLKIKA